MGKITTDQIPHKIPGKKFTAGEFEIVRSAVNDVYDEVQDTSDLASLAYLQSSQAGTDESTVNSLISKFYGQKSVDIFPWKDYKLITLGDSITAGHQWQPWLVRWNGFIFNLGELLNGDGTHQPTAIGGTTISGIYDDSGAEIYHQGKSIYARADAIATAYKPTNNKYVILVMGGYNDTLTGGFQGNDLGTVDDEAYLGNELPYNTTDPKPTFSSFYKGLLRKLITQNPYAKIFVMMPYDNNASWTVPNTGLLDKETIIKAAANQYNLPLINLRAESGINPANVGIMLGDGTHINELGGKLVAQTIQPHLI